MSDPDVQLDLKKRARRRLVGALALTLAAAVILPMVMDSEPKPLGNELQIRIPSQEGANYASRLIGVAPPVPPVDEKPLEVASPSEPQALPPAAAQPEPIQAPIAKPEAPKPVMPEAAPKPAGAVTEKPVHIDEAKRAAMILAGKTPVPAPAANEKSSANGGFYVQLGAYRDSANVKTLQIRLKKAGFSSTTESLGDRTRVRIGPFDSRAAADKALLKLKAAGMSGVVTAR